MPRLLRIHFASIGHPDARLAPLTLDLRHGDGTGEDSLLWLRNGGGKSSILNLFFSTFRPDRRDFLGTNAEGKVRHLEDYVKDTDLAFVLTEWDAEPPEAITLFSRRPKRTRVVGQMLHWKGQQRSRDASRMRRLFFSFRTDEEVVFESIPVQGLADPVTSFEGFREWLQARPALEPVMTEHHTQWREHLERLGLDPELFGYQIRMNLREGAADEQFRFSSPKEFVRFFLQLAFNAQHADLVSANLAKYGEQLKRRPELLLERTFTEAVLEELRPLVTDVEAMRQGEKGLEAAVQDAAGTAAALAADAAVLEARAVQAREAAAQAEADESAASNAHRRLTRWADGLTRRARELELEEARAALEQARRDRDSRATRVKVLEAAGILAEVRRQEAEVNAKLEALRQSEAELEPLRRQVAQAGAVLYRRLEEAIAARLGRAGEVRSEVAAAVARVASGRETLEQVNRERGSVDALIEQLRQRLSRRDAARQRLQEQGWIELREEAAAALERWCRRLDSGRARQDGIEEEDARLSAVLESLGARLEEARAAHARHQLEAQHLRASLDEAAAWRQRLLEAGPLRELEGFYPHQLADARELVSRLRAQAEGVHRQVLQLRVDGAEDERALEAVAATGLLPPSRDVEAVVERLREHRIPAHSGLSYLAENWPEAEREAVLLGDPARFSGAIVPGEAALERVRALRHTFADLRGAVQVSLPRRAQATDAADAVVLPPGQAGVYDLEAAAAQRAVLEARRDVRTEEESRLRTLERDLLDTATDLASYQDRYGEGRLERAERAWEEAVTAARAAEQASLDLAEERNTAQTRRRELKEEAGRLQRELTAAEKARTALDAFIETHELELPKLRNDLEEARNRQAELERRAEMVKADIAREEALREERAAVLRELEKEVQALEAERDGVSIRATEEETREEAGTAAPAGLEEARARWLDLYGLYSRETSENRLKWELEAVQRALGGARERLRKAAAGLEALEIEVALPMEPGALEAARAAQSLAEQAIGEAKGAVREAEARLQDAMKGRREAEDLPPDEPPPTRAIDALARAEAFRQEGLLEAERISQARVRQQEHHAQEEHHGRRAERWRGQRALLLSTAESLPEVPPAPLPEQDDDVLALVQALQSRYKAARGLAERTREQAVRRAEKVRDVVLEDRFESHRNQIRERLRASAIELFDVAGVYSDQLVDRLKVIEEQLAGLDAHRARLVADLEMVASNAVSLLKRVEEASRLPKEVPVWGGRAYLRILFDAPRTPEERRTRLEPLVDQIVAGARVPGGLELAQQAVEMLAGGRDFDVRILKPDAVLKLEPVGIDEMARFSRGQQLTAAILLYCTLAQLRARARGQERGRQDAGILILDNPIGTCSSPQMLELQRTMARAMRIQLIYTTGVNDPNALAILPNVVRLRNTHRDRRTGDFHVTPEGYLDSVRVRLREEVEA